MSFLWISNAGTSSFCVCVFHGCGSLCSVVFCSKLSGSQFKKTKTKKQEAEQRRGVNNFFLLNLPCKVVLDLVGELIGGKWFVFAAVNGSSILG